MAINVNDKIKRLNPAQRKKLEDRVEELIAEEMTLRQLRKARKLTQVHMARKLGITQDGVSRLEQRSDLLLSTLRKHVEGMGGHLSLVAKFPDYPPVVISAVTETAGGVRHANARLKRKYHKSGTVARSGRRRGRKAK